MHFTKSLLLLLIVFLNVHIFAQSSRISEFEVSKIGEKSVKVFWTMPLGATCLDLSVQRSSDSVNFKSVYTYPGVCGSEDETTSYNWIDNSTLIESLNYYRLKLENAEFTEVRKIDLRSGFIDSPIIIFPNPSNRYINIKIDGNLNELFLIKILAVNGEILFRLVEPSNKEIEVDVSGFNSGIYSFQVVTKTGLSFMELFIVN